MRFIRKVLCINLSENLTYVRNISNSAIVKSDKIPEEAIPKNPLQKYYNGHLQPKGKIYDKRPFRMNLKPGKKYAWCTCGHSKSQPLCDGSHNIQDLRVNLRPIYFMVEEEKEYWLCNCKQSDHRPFCDGSHRDPEIQKIKYVKM